ncbi:MAG: tyrosine-type recombinase/integrase [Solirubrobacteraceae bacterium]
MIEDGSAARPSAGAKRRYGTGSIFEKRNAWYGQWRVRNRTITRKLGPIRTPGSRDGLTRKMAEARLRKLMAEVTPPPVYERMTVSEAGERLIKQLVTRGRKASTTIGYESYLRVHVGPFFGEKQIADITKDDIEQFVAVCLENEQSIKSTRNYLGFLHSIFDFALRNGWVAINPCKAVEKPEVADDDQDIRFLDQAELDALLAATAGPRSRRKPETADRVRRVRRLRDGGGMLWKRIGTELGIAESTAIYLYGLDLDEVGLPDPLRAVDRVLYLTAAMTGMRQGELLALRWMDVDWTAHRIRVRRNLVRGRFGTPKSKRSTRSIPLADGVARELELLFKASLYQADEDLVFAHPHTGKPLDRSQLLKRYKAALKRAGVREIRFHDLRHTFGTRMAAAGVPMRTLQEWMGHRDFKTTLIYADYAPAANEAEFVNAAFARGASINLSINLSETDSNSKQETPVNTTDAG